MGARNERRQYTPQKTIEKRAAAELFDRHPRTLKRWSEDKRTGFPQFHKIRGQDYVYEDELVEFIALNPGLRTGP